MKRWKIVLPTLLATSGLPLVSLVGCEDKPGPEPEVVDFTTSGEKMTSTTSATFNLDWAGGHSLVFDSWWSFETNAGEVQSVTGTGGDTRPQTVTITFKNEIEQDVTDGKLTFTYSDKTTKQESVTGVVENIHIPQYSPEPEEVEFDTSEGQMDSATTGTFKLIADPSTHDLEFDLDSWAFTSTSVGNANNVSYDEATQMVSLVFSSDISTEINDGVLSFTYDDKTTGTEDIDVTIENVHLDAYTPEPEEVEFDTSDGQMDSATTGTFKLIADPSSHNLEFCQDSWTFNSASVGDANSVSYDETSNIVSLVFSSEVSSAINDGVLSFTYDDKTTGTEDIYVTVDNIHLDAYTPPTPGRTNFNTCDWKYINDVCLTYEQRYSPDVFVNNFYFDDLTTTEEEHIIPTSLDDFVGQQRIVYLDRPTEENAYYVRVLGIGQDYTSTNDPDKIVALTFQFDTPVGNGSDQPICWNGSLDNNYWNSDINNFLNNELPQRIVAGFDIKWIKPVYRTALYHHQTIRSEMPVKFFMPLLSNIFSSDGLKTSFGSQADYYINEGQILDSVEIQSQYSLYKNNIGDQPALQKSYPILCKTRNNQYVDYWLTTTLALTIKESWMIRSHMQGKEEGEIFSSYVTDTYYVAPCFCI